MWLNWLYVPHEETASHRPLLTIFSDLCRIPSGSASVHFSDWMVNCTYGYAMVGCHVIYSHMITIAWAITRIGRSNGWHWNRFKRICIHRQVIFGVLVCCCGNWRHWLWCHSRKSIRLNWLLTCVTVIDSVNQLIVLMNCKFRWVYTIFMFYKYICGLSKHRCHPRRYCFSFNHHHTIKHSFIIILSNPIHYAFNNITQAYNMVFINCCGKLIFNANHRLTAIKIIKTWPWLVMPYH